MLSKTYIRSDTQRTHKRWKKTLPLRNVVSLFVMIQHSNAEANTARMYSQPERRKRLTLSSRRDALIASYSAFEILCSEMSHSALEIPALEFCACSALVGRG